MFQFELNWLSRILTVSYDSCLIEISDLPVCTLTVWTSSFIDSSIIANEPVVSDIGPVIAIHVIVLNSSDSAHAFRFRKTTMTGSMMSDNSSRCWMIKIADTSRISCLPFNARDKVWCPFDALCPWGRARFGWKCYISLQLVTTRRISDTSS